MSAGETAHGGIGVDVQHISDDVNFVTVERNQHPPGRSGGSTKSGTLRSALEPFLALERRDWAGADFGRLMPVGGVLTGTRLIHVAYFVKCLFCNIELKARLPIAALVTFLNHLGAFLIGGGRVSSAAGGRFFCR